MNIETWFMFVATTFIASMAPGPSVLLGLNNGFIHGKRKSVATALGITTAALAMGVLALLGLGTLLVTSGEVFLVVKYIGSAYLIYTGIKAWRQPVSKTHNSEGDLQTSSNGGFLKLYFQALIVGLSNPKAIIFFTALFPQFIDTSSQNINQFIILLITLGSVAFICMMIYIIGGQSLAPLLKKANIRKILNKVTGGTFISFGVGVAVSD